MGCPSECYYRRLIHNLVVSAEQDVDIDFDYLRFERSPRMQIQFSGSKISISFLLSHLLASLLFFGNYTRVHVRQLNYAITVNWDKSHDVKKVENVKKCFTLQTRRILRVSRFICIDMFDSFWSRIK